MKLSDSMLAMFLAKLKELRANGYDPYNSVGPLRIGKLGHSFSWRG